MVGFAHLDDHPPRVDVGEMYVSHSISSSQLVRLRDRSRVDTIRRRGIKRYRDSDNGSRQTVGFRAFDSCVSNQVHRRPDQMTAYRCMDPAFFGKIHVVMASFVIIFTVCSSRSLLISELQISHDENVHSTGRSWARVTSRGLGLPQISPKCSVMN